jgi:hypothetical protein
MRSRLPVETSACTRGQASPTSRSFWRPVTGCCAYPTKVCFANGRPLGSVDVHI